jgi:hypothetical protein
MDCYLRTVPFVGRGAFYFILSASNIRNAGVQRTPVGRLCTRMRLSSFVSGIISARAINSPADRTELREIRTQLPQTLIREEREKRNEK